jgi:hypothetical protein
MVHGEEDDVIPLNSAKHGSPRVEELALPKSVEGGNLSLNKVVIRWNAG